MSEDRRVRITEVGPRDGLQNESAIVPVAEKIAFVDALGEAGFPEIEVTSFVSPKWVPRLADAAEVMSGIERKASITYSVLCPNQRGAEAALRRRVRGYRRRTRVFRSTTKAFDAQQSEVVGRLLPRAPHATRS